MYKCVDTIVCIRSRQLCKLYHFSTQLTGHDKRTVPTQYACIVLNKKIIWLIWVDIIHKQSSMIHSSITMSTYWMSACYTSVYITQPSTIITYAISVNKYKMSLGNLRVGLIVTNRPILHFKMLFTGIKTGHDKRTVPTQYTFNVYQISFSSLLYSIVLNKKIIWLIWVDIIHKQSSRIQKYFNTVITINLFWVNSSSDYI
jgi:hypothetical protein